MAKNSSGSLTRRTVIASVSVFTLADGASRRLGAGYRLLCDDKARRNSAGQAKEIRKSRP